MRGWGCGGDRTVDVEGGVVLGGSEVEVEFFEEFAGGGVFEVGVGVDFGDLGVGGFGPGEDGGDRFAGESLVPEGAGDFVVEAGEGWGF